MFTWLSRFKSPVKILTLALTAFLLVIPLTAASKSTAAWASSGQSIVNWRSQPLESTINAKNVNKLSPLFKIATDGDVSATPNISGGVAYFPDWGGSLWAVDATTSDVIWKVKLADYTGIPGTVSRSTPTSAGMGTLLVGTQQGAYLLAINERDGSLEWMTQLDPHPMAVLTSSPSVFQGTAYLGVSSMEELAAENPDYSCCTFRGSMVAVDISTGAIKWQKYTTPDNGGVAGGYSGNSIWGSQPVVDPARDSVYVGTGNNYTVPSCVSDGSCAMDPTNYTDAVISYDMATGKINWVDPLMGVSSDAFNGGCFFPPFANCPANAGPDYDFGQAPMKLKATINGKLTDILGIGQKSGAFWAINPDTGAVIWSTQGGPGSFLGGMEWGSATDGTRIYYSIANAYGIPYTMINGQTTTGGLWGALDPATGKILWQTADPTGGNDVGAVSVANGVVYVGSLGYSFTTYDPSPAATAPTFFALDAATGKILWSYVSGGSVNSGAAIANGVVYWGSGYGNADLGLANHEFYAFSIK